MLVVAPIVILAIGAFITVIVSMTGEVLSSRASNNLAYDVQDALARIEQDVKLSTGFLATNSIAVTSSNKQGYNNDATAFTSSAGASGTTLILNMLVTNDNPASTSAGLVYLTSQPNSCSSSQIQQNTPMTMNVIYFVKPDPNNNNIPTLWRRTLMPSNYNGSTSVRCTTPWQQPSCAPGVTGSSICTTDDVKLVAGVDPSSFFVQYFTTASSNEAVAAATDPDPAVRATALQASPTINVSINASQSVAGRTVERSGTLRATRLDINATTIAAANPAVTPDAPVVSSLVNEDATVTFSWPRAVNASTYIYQYRINSGSWSTATTTSSRSFTVSTSTHTDVVEARVQARDVTATYTSGYGTSSATVPLWLPLNLGNNWTSYLSTYAPASYTKTSNGVVVVKGLLKRGGTPVANEVIATLPAGYRPEATLLFGNTTNSNVAGRVDVGDNGDIIFRSGSAGWYSLDTIRFVPNGPYTRTATTLANGWTNYGTPYANATSVVDNSGRIWQQGLIKPGTYGDGLALRTLTSTQDTSHYALYSGYACNGWAWYDISPTHTEGLRIRNVNPGGCMSLQLSWYPNTFTGWTTMTMQNSWGNYSSTWSPASYTKSSDGLVSLRGMISGGSATYDTPVTTLPAGFRPKERLLMTTTNNSGHSRIDILPDGQVRFMGSSNVWYSLDPVSFIAEQ
jgi:hypothetical protein